MEANAICRYVVDRSQKVPVAYVRQIHKYYALQINSISNIQDAALLMRQMILEYCQCVQDYSLAQYSPLIRRVIGHIRTETARPLSLRSLAEQCNVNASYLSNLFRTETGMTLTEYINQYRIEKAVPLLLHTGMSIAQVSESVGFLDENYFARIFKKIMGVSPNVHRKNNQK